MDKDDERLGDEYHRRRRELAAVRDLATIDAAIALGERSLRASRLAEQLGYVAIGAFLVGIWGGPPVIALGGALLLAVAVASARAEWLWRRRRAPPAHARDTSPAPDRARP